MYVSIWDLDWYYQKSSIPNVDCMRLSSYHKQKGDKINFISQQTHLDLRYDIIYIACERDDVPKPDSKFIKDKRTVLLGRGFRLYNVKTIGAVVVACRPDYLLYPNMSGAYANADFVTYYAGNQLIKSRQDWHNTKNGRKKTIVTDRCFWKMKDEDIIWCLQDLKEEKNIAFLEPISIRKMLGNKSIRQKFLALHFSSGTIFRWCNDYGSTYEQALDILSFLKQLRAHTKSDLGFIPFRAQLISHEEQQDFELDLLRNFQIVAAFKTAKMKAMIVAPKNRLESPHWAIFSGLEYWTSKTPQLSYVEFVTHSICKSEGLDWDGVINNKLKWKNNYINFLIRLLIDEKWVHNRNLFYIQWGDRVLNSSKIDFKYLYNNVNLI